MPDPERSLVLEEYFIHAAITQPSDRLDLLRRQRRTEQLIVLMFQNPERHRDKHIVGHEFIAVAALDEGTRTGVVDGAPAYATDGLAILERTAGQVAQERRQHADVAEGHTHIAARDLDEAAELIGRDHRQVVAATTAQAVRQPGHDARCVVSVCIWMGLSDRNYA